MPSPIMTNYPSTRRCRAKSKSTGVQCQNAAAYGCATCYVHGARRPESIRRGRDHPSYKHGERTKEAQQQAHDTAVELRELEQLARDMGMIAGPRTRGRKPTGTQ